VSVYYTFRPISSWPWAVTQERTRAQFKKASRHTGDGAGGTRWIPQRELTLAEATQQLLRELEAIEAEDVVFEVDVPESRIRQDGGIYSGTRASSPRVVVSFRFAHGAMRYKSDRYTRFEDNLVAIARTLEALRTVDRHGVSSRGEQYQGWKALPAQSSVTMDSYGAAKLVALWAGEPPLPEEGEVTRIVGNPGWAKATIRKAAKRVHPDVEGGSAEKFQQLQVAKRALEAHHGEAL
jgi:hypothetical protein